MSSNRGRILEISGFTLSKQKLKPLRILIEQQGEKKDT